MTRHRVMPTPTERGVTHVTLGMEIQVRSVRGVLPKLDALGHAFARRAFVRDTAMDAEGWQALSLDEAAGARGTIAAYWLWAKQFHTAQARPERTSSC